MRTTLDIDAEILKAAKALALAEQKTLGQVLSELVRKGLAASAPGEEEQAGYDAGEPVEQAQITPRKASEVSHADDTRHRR
jgi:hypothetical protein